jgi:hypothetical protein
VINVNNIADINGSSPQRRTFRSTGQVVGSVVFSLCIMVAMIAKVPHASNPSARVIGWVIIGLLAILAIREALWSVTVNAEGIRIRGVIRTHRLNWSEIDHFSLGRLGVFPAVGIAYRKQGQPIAMTAIEMAKMSTGKERAKTEAMIEELNLLLREHQGREPLA